MLEAIFKHFLLYTVNITWQLSTVVISHIAIKNILQEDLEHLRTRISNFANAKFSLNLRPFGIIK